MTLAYPITQPLKVSVLGKYVKSEITDPRDEFSFLTHLGHVKSDQRRGERNEFLHPKISISLVQEPVWNLLWNKNFLK